MKGPTSSIFRLYGGLCIALSLSLVLPLLAFGTEYYNPGGTDTKPEQSIFEPTNQTDKPKPETSKPPVIRIDNREADEISRELTGLYSQIDNIVITSGALTKNSAELKSNTSSMETALADWEDLKAQLKQRQSEICDQAGKLGSSRHPSAQQITALGVKMGSAGWTLRLEN